MLRQVLFLLTICLSLPASAHPVSYQGATGVMTWNQSFMTDDWVTYSFRSDAALAARIMRMETLEGRVQYLAPQLDYLLKRWNETNSQANIYVYGSYGALNFQNSTSSGGLAGLEADAESRKDFASVQYEKMWADRAPDFYRLQARVGLAPYEAEFTEIATWFMIQYEYHPSLVRKYAVTPLARMFYKNFLFEAGVSTEGDWMTNFMFHF